MENEYGTREGAEPTHGKEHSAMLGAVRNLQPKDRAVLVTIEPDDDGGCLYVVESFGCDKEPHVVMGVLQAGLAYVQYDLMQTWDSEDEEDEQEPEPAGDESPGDGEGS